MKPFADALKDLMADRSVDQSALAAFLGVNQGTVSRYESNKRRPDVETMEQIEVFFGFPPGSYFRETLGPRLGQPRASPTSRGGRLDRLHAGRQQQR